MYMKSYTLLALLAATMTSTTEAVQLTSAGGAASLAGAEGPISDSDLIGYVFEFSKEKVEDGTLGKLAYVAAAS